MQPSHLRDKPYLQPVYDEPEFIIRNVYRCLGSWYSGRPSDLKPATWSQQAAEIVLLAGSIGKLIERARHWLTQGQYRMACHVIDWAQEADPDNRDVQTLRAEIYRQRTAHETFTMARGVFGAAAREAEDKSSHPTPGATS